MKEYDRVRVVNKDSCWYGFDGRVSSDPFKNSHGMDVIWVDVNIFGKQGTIGKGLFIQEIPQMFRVDELELVVSKT